jgi:hypothetical protein
VHISRVLQSSFLPLFLVVFSVTQNASDVNHPPSVFDSSNQPTSVMAYIDSFLLFVDGRLPAPS